MFEHLRNWPEMFRRVAGWLEPQGRFFMHVFVHRGTPYSFEARDASDWMARHFFSGGMMPSDDLALRFQDDLSLVARWRWSGTHYARTAEAWLANMDARREPVTSILAQTYGAEHAALWWTRWRLFFMSCAELFGHDQGREWWVAHYLFEPTRRHDARCSSGSTPPGSVSAWARCSRWRCGQRAWRKRDVSIVDSAWSFLVLAPALVDRGAAAAAGPRAAVVLTLAAAWALRLVAPHRVAPPRAAGGPALSGDPQRATSRTSRGRACTSCSACRRCSRGSWLCR